MANEPTKVVLFGDSGEGRTDSATCADGTNIPKWSLLTYSDPFTVAIAVDAGLQIRTPAGVSIMEKEASDGSTSVSFVTDGVIDATASDAITVGQKVVCAGENKVRAASTAEAGSSFALIFGVARETATHGERVNIRFNL